MKDDEILISHARDLKSRCADKSMITNTYFLDMRQRALLSKIERESSGYVKTYYYGGYAQAERVCAVFVPSFYEVNGDETNFFEEYSDENPLTLIRIDKDRFTSLSHRDYLGSLMGLGLKREMLGDILTDGSGAYIICMKSTAEFLKLYLISVGRASAQVKDASFSELSDRKESFKEIKASVASLRLDNVASAAFSLSRTNCSGFIEKGAVFVNSAQVTKPDFRLDVGDKIVLRGKGKAVLSSVDATSRKGRIHVTLKRFL